ncbi:MAG: amidohydrolase family protein [Actinomycetota bacterium]|nr:amidohydrolase family protein [Actinomycetota bacterium]
MINDMLVVDAAVHAANGSKENIAEPILPMADPLLEAVYGLHAMLSPESHRLAPEELLRDWSGEELERLLFLESDVDLCDYHSLPLDDFFVDGLVRLEKGVEMKRRTPHRVCLHAAINPLEGKRALEQVEHSIRDLGAHGIKVYPARFVQGQTIPVRLDDPEYGIPVVERAIECGAKCIAVHKYFPIGPTRLSAYGVDDVEIAGAFPQVNFEVLHAGFAFVDETAWLLARYPNVYVNLEWTVSLLFSAPRRFAEILGSLMYWGGEDRILWAAGAMLVHPQAALEAFLDFEMPEDLVEGYGFPPLTAQAKRKILGENYCRLHGLDVDEKRARVENDEWAKQRRDASSPEAWSSVRAPRPVGT